jgi:hypothetical protein
LPRRFDRLGRPRRDLRGGPRPSDVIGEGPGDGFDVGSEGSIVGEVPGGVFANDVDDAGAGFAGVMKVREGVGETGAEVQRVAAGRPAMRK